MILLFRQPRVELFYNIFPPTSQVINIVTSEDGSRKGLTLAEELRQNLSNTNESVPIQEVPYLKSPSPLKTVIEETPEEHASKCSLLGALGKLIVCLEISNNIYRRFNVNLGFLKATKIKHRK